MNLFNNLIICTNCGKNYNFKKDHNSKIYICSGTKNYGKLFCPRRIIYEEHLIYIVGNHCKLYNKQFKNYRDIISKIEINIYGEVKILYKDKKITIWDSTQLIF